jgi:hypothetical protein
VQLNQRPIVKELAEENNISETLFKKAFESFVEYCSNFRSLDIALKIAFSDIKLHGKSIFL